MKLRLSRDFILICTVQDSNSIPPSPHIPKIHNIHIRREPDGSQAQQPARPRSAMSTTTICSETSVDFEVQNILGAHKAAKSGNPNESQEIIIDFDSSVASNNSFVLNNSNVINRVKRSQTFNNRKNLDNPDRVVRAHSITRSSAERSLDEMSLYDQMCLHKSKKPHKKDPRVEEYRNLVLAEIKSMTAPGVLARSLSESDLSDLGGLSGGSDGEAGPTSHRDNKVRHKNTQQRSRSSPRSEAMLVCSSTPSSGYSELTSSSGN